MSKKSWHRLPWYKSLFYWFAGWYHTWHIKKYNPELYKYLSDLADKHDIEDYVRVERPGRTVYIHKAALENMRKLGEEDNGPVA